MESTAQLCRALDQAGLELVARHLAELARRPGAFEVVKPMRRIRNCEFELRRWIRSEPAEHLEEAIAQLLVGVLALKLSPASIDAESPVTSRSP